MADTPYSIIHDHIYSPLPLPRSINPEIPEPVERILLRALAKERQDRFPDISALLDAWHQAIQEPSEALVPPSAVVEAPVAQPADERLENPLTGQAHPDEVPIVALPAVPDSGKPLVEQSTVAQTSQEKVAKRNPLPVWMVVGIVLVIVCLCAGASIFYSSARKKALQASVTETLLEATIVLMPTSQPQATPYPQSYAYPLASAIVTPLPAGRPAKPIWTALQATGALSQTGQLEAALAGIQQAPQSATAYLDLAIAYGVQGKPEEAQKAFKTAVGLAAVPADFYELAGDRVADREAWALAATMYLEALNRVPDPLPVTLSDKINRSLYLAANVPELQAILGKVPAGRLTPGIIDVVRARGIIYRGEAILARAAIRRIKAQFPENPAVRLLDAELLSHGGDVEQAKGILKSSISDSNTPGWVQWVAEYLLNKAKN